MTLYYNINKRIYFSPIKPESKVQKVQLLSIFLTFSVWLEEETLKQSALEIWGMWSTLSLPLLPGPLIPGGVVLDRVLSLDQIVQTVCGSK